MRTPALVLAAAMTATLPLSASAAESGFRVCRRRYSAAVVIDRSGKWWHGTETADLDTYLKEFKAGGYEVEHVSYAICSNYSGEIRWVSIGLRCVKDDVLGVYADWKIDYAPSRQLLDHA